MKSKTMFVAAFTCLFFIAYAFIWYSLSLVSAFKFYGSLQQALGDSKFHVAAITDTYEMTTRLIMGICLGWLLWEVKKKYQQKVIA